MKIKYWECSCQSPEHNMRFCFDRTETVPLKNKEVQDILEADTYTIWDTVDVDIHLNRNSGFFRRLWIAIRYVLGMRIGHWEYSEVAIIEVEKLPELISFLQDIYDYCKSPKEEKDGE